MRASRSKDWNKIWANSGLVLAAPLSIRKANRNDVSSQFVGKNVSRKVKSKKIDSVQVYFEQTQFFQFELAVANNKSIFLIFPWNLSTPPSPSARRCVCVLFFRWSMFCRTQWWRLDWWRPILAKTGLLKDRLGTLALLLGVFVWRFWNIFNVFVM